MDRWTPPSFDTPAAARVRPQGSETVSPAPSTGVALPTIDEVQSIRAKAYQEAFARGLQEGLVEGQTQGMALGREEGIDKGRAEGFQTGYQQGYQSGSQEVERLARALNQVLETLAELPQTLASTLPEWVYETALRLAGKEHMDRSVFVAAVQEALLRLPRPGEGLVVGVPQSEQSAWEALLRHPDMPFQAVVRPDAELAPGYAYVQVEGTRLDVGSRAREALVRSALGLLPQAEQGQS